MATESKVPLGPKIPTSEEMEKIEVGRFKATEKGWSYLGSEIPKEWEKMEGDLASQLKNLDIGKWEREDNEWFLKGKDGKIIDRTNPKKDDCRFFGDNPNSCTAFLACVNNPDKECVTVMNVMGDLIPDIQKESPEKIKEKISKLHPMAAVRYLQSMGFKTLREIAPSSTMTGGHGKKLHEDVVECVTDWVNRLVKTDELKEKLGSNYPALKDLAMGKGSEEDLKAFHNYLNFQQILVDWVNANDQVLNEEFTFDQPRTGMMDGCLKPRYDYNICGPYYTPQYRRAKNICEAITHMKAGLESEAPGGVGWHGRSILDSIMFTQPAQMTLTPGMFTRSAIANYQFGGHGAIEETRRNMMSGAEPYGYQSYEALYNELKNMMQSMGSADDKYKIRLKDRTNDAIQKKLNKLKETEEAVIKALEDAMKTQNLYRASHSRIDLRQIYRKDDPKLQEELRHGAYGKNADLVGMSSLYNRRASEMLSTLLVIANAIIDKYDSKMTGAPTATSGIALNKIYIPGRYTP
jgi:hypothetical protein